MISTVTTTVSTIVSSSSVSGLVLGLGLMAVLTLILSLAIKEVATHGVSGWRTFNHNLGIITLPLLFVFLFILSTMIIELIA